MKLSNLTLQVLNNFSSIGSKLIFNKDKAGYIAHSDVDDHIFAYYDLPEEEKEIPEFGIFDMTLFLSVLKEMVGSADFDIKFEEKHLILKTKFSAVKYIYAPISLLPEPPKRKDISAMPSLLTFVLKKEHLQKLLKMANVMKIGNIQIEVLKTNITGIVKDVKNETSNVFKLILGQTKSADIPTITWNISSWKMIGDYDYKVSLLQVGDKRKFSKFEVIDSEGKTLGLTYYITVLAD
jgi:hypothetical protein